MAKFKQNNVELRDGQKVILDSAKEKWITYDGSETLINTTLSGITPTQDGHLATKGYVDTEVAGAGGISNVVEDATPQLGGDLDLNSHAIDFPTTANITDCLDEDTMASNSATAIATQQSIKAYVDAEVTSISTDKIEEGNSSVEVVDTGTGYIKATVDGNERLRLTDDMLKVGDNPSDTSLDAYYGMYIQKDADAAYLTIISNKDHANLGPRLYFNKSRGDSLSSPTQVQDGDTIFFFNGLGYDATYGGGSYRSGCTIRGYVDGSPTGNGHIPSKINILVDDGTSTTSVLMYRADGTVEPGANGTQDFGTSSLEWDNIYCVTLNESSDENKKENIQSSPHGLAYVLASRPITYTFKDTVNSGIREVGEDENGDSIMEEYCDVITHSRTHLGFSAQEQVEVIEDLGYTTADIDTVTIGQDGDHSIRYSHYVPILVKAIQEQQTIIEALEARIEALENA